MHVEDWDFSFILLFLTLYCSITCQQMLSKHYLLCNIRWSISDILLLMNEGKRRICKTATKPLPCPGDPPHTSCLSSLSSVTYYSHYFLSWYSFQESILFTSVLLCIELHTATKWESIVMEVYHFQAVFCRMFAIQFIHTNNRWCTQMGAGHMNKQFQTQWDTE
jgi:hypothetical protein